MQISTDKAIALVKGLKGSVFIPQYDVILKFKETGMKNVLSEIKELHQTMSDRKKYHE
jgi:hypothetical protein